MSANHGLSTQAEITESITSHLPLTFGEARAVDAPAFLKKFNEFLDYASAVSAPFLGPDTIRYQTMLLTLSLFLVAIDVFRFTVVKLFDISVPVNARLFAIYGALIAAVAAIFVTKALVDYLRTRFVRMKNANVTTDLDFLVNVALHLRHIQDYFWLEIFDAIGGAYKFYRAFADAVSRSADSSPFTVISMQVLNLDRALLAKIPQTRIEIDRLDRYRQRLLEELESDKTHFLKEAEVIVENHRKQDQSDPEVFLRNRSYDEMELAYQRHLQKWIEARTELSDRKLVAVGDRIRKNPEAVQANAVKTVLKRVLLIRFIYAVCEVAAPVIFAAAAILLVTVR